MFDDLDDDIVDDVVSSSISSSEDSDEAVDRQRQPIGHVCFKNTPSFGDNVVRIT